MIVLYQELDLGFGDGRPVVVGEVSTLEQAKSLVEADALSHGRILERYLLQDTQTWQLTKTWQLNDRGKWKRQP